MESTRLAAIARELQQERTQVASEETRLREQLAAVETNLARIDAALAALEGSQLTPRTAKTSKPVESKKCRTPSPKKADVVEAMRIVLQQDEILESDALKKRVEAELQTRGFNRFGLAMRLNEACRSPQFVETPGGFRLAEENNPVSVAG
jgi:hypothetical protein